jgi:hypothetical protein
VWTLAALLLNPANIIVDHGHFQYNCISLGCALAAAAAICQGWHVLGSIFFCAALNHKQMSLYYAPAFFAHLLGRCFQARSFVGKVRVLARHVQMCTSLYGGSVVAAAAAAYHHHTITYTPTQKQPPPRCPDIPQTVAELFTIPISLGRPTTGRWEGLLSWASWSSPPSM